jgi:AbrB family looped-hinge helix DNA binding protein
MRVSSKGQVTIPKRVREQAGIEVGTEADIELACGVITLQRSAQRPRPGPTRDERLVAAIRGAAAANRGVSTDEIMKLLRGDD